MIELLKKLISFYLFAGVDKKEYSIYKRDITKANYDALNTMCVLAFIIYFCLFGVSFVFSAYEKTRVLYAISTMIFTALYVAIILINRKNSILIKIMLYFAIVCNYAVAAYFGTFLHPSTNMTFICVLIVVLPICILERPIVTNTVTALSSALTIYMAYKVKNNSVFVIDAVNIISLTFLSQIFCCYFTRSKIKEIISRHYIISQRDTDALTNILNRGAIQHRITKYLDGHSNCCAMIVMDLDNFKSINDNFGHMYGDDTLKITADILKSEFEEDDFIARVGGDEFVIFIKNFTDRNIMSKKIERLIRRLDRTILKNNHKFDVTVSVGIAVSEKCEESYDLLFKNADDAMYSAKKNGKNQFKFFEG